MIEYPEHGPAQSELDDAREYVREENYSQAAHHVNNAYHDVEHYAVLDYGVWRERYDDLTELFAEVIEWKKQHPMGESWSTASDSETDQEVLLDILDELEKSFSEMDRLVKEFRERYAATGSPQNTATGWAQEGDLGLTEDDVPEDLRVTCVGCRRGVTQIGSAFFYLENHPGERLLCGECLFEIDVVDREEADELEISTSD